MVDNKAEKPTSTKAVRQPAQESSSQGQRDTSSAEQIRITGLDVAKVSAAGRARIDYTVDYLAGRELEVDLTGDPLRDGEIILSAVQDDIPKLLAGRLASLRWMSSVTGEYELTVPGGGRHPRVPGGLTALARRLAVVTPPKLPLRSTPRGNPMSFPPLLASLQRTSPSSVRFWRHAGRGPRSIKVDRRVLSAQRDVDAWLAGLNAEGTA